MHLEIETVRALLAPYLPEVREYRKRRNDEPLEDIIKSMVLFNGRCHGNRDVPETVRSLCNQCLDGVPMPKTHNEESTCPVRLQNQLCIEGWSQHSTSTRNGFASCRHYVMMGRFTCRTASGERDGSTKHKMKLFSLSSSLCKRYKERFSPETFFQTPYELRRSILIRLRAFKKLDELRNDIFQEEMDIINNNYIEEPICNISLDKDSGIRESGLNTDARLSDNSLNKETSICDCILDEDMSVCGSILDGDISISDSILDEDVHICDINLDEEISFCDNSLDEGISIHSSSSGTDMMIRDSNSTNGTSNCFCIMDTDTHIPSTISNKDMCIPDTSSVKDTPLPDSSSVKDTPLPDISSVIDIQLPDSSSVKDTSLPHRIPVKDTARPDNNSVKETAVPDNSLIKNSDADSHVCYPSLDKDKYDTDSAAVVQMRELKKADNSKYRLARWARRSILVTGKHDPDNRSSKDTRVVDSSSVKDTSLPYISSVKDTPIPSNSSVKDTPLPDNSSVKDTPLPHNSAVNDTPLPHSNSVKDTLIPHSSSLKDTHIPHNSSVKDTHIPHNSSANDTHIPHNSVVRDTPPDNSLVKNTDNSFGTDSLISISSLKKDTIMWHSSLDKETPNPASAAAVPHRELKKADRAKYRLARWAGRCPRQKC